MEVAVMSLSAREQQALDSIEDRLVGSDPRLAALLFTLLLTFSRLTSGDAMPAREEVPGQARWTRRALRRARRLLAAYAGLDRTMALLWVLITVGLIAVAAVLSGGGSGRACVRSWAVACTAPAPANHTALVVPSSS
jgi:hypothetical protein